MPKNKGKGGKNRRRGKNENESMKRELIFKEDGQEYAQVIKMLGNGRLEVMFRQHVHCLITHYQAMCFDGVKRLCHIRGKLRKKVWINAGDIILVGLREYQDAKADVIQKYNADEARNLKSYNEIPENVKLEVGQAEPDENDIRFDKDANVDYSDDSDNEDACVVAPQNFIADISDDDESSEPDDLEAKEFKDTQVVGLGAAAFKTQRIA